VLEPFISGEYYADPGWPKVKEPPMEVYLRFDEKARHAHETRELIPGVVLADYDDDGNLIGVEVLGVLSGAVDGLPWKPSRE